MMIFDGDILFHSKSSNSHRVACGRMLVPVHRARSRRLDQPLGVGRLVKDRNGMIVNFSPATRPQKWSLERDWWLVNSALDIRGGQAMSPLLL